MQLRFYARPGHLMSLPGVRVAGTRPRYVGRRVVVQGTTIINRPTDEPEGFDPQSAEGKRLQRVMLLNQQNPPLWPADVETARACGVRFVPVERDEHGEYQPKPVKRDAGSEKHSTPLKGSKREVTA